MLSTLKHIRLVSSSGGAPYHFLRSSGTHLYGVYLSKYHYLRIQELNFSLFWDWPRSFYFLCNKCLTFDYDYTIIDMIIVKSVSKSFHNWWIICSCNIGNTKICYRNKITFCVEFEMFHAKFYCFCWIVIWQNVREMERISDEVSQSSLATLASLLTLIYGTRDQFCSLHQSMSS